MRVLYFDCPMGLAGDMVLGALIDAGASLDVVTDTITSLQLEGVELVVSETMKGDFRAKSVRVEHPKQHAHRHLSDVREILSRGDLTPNARRIADELFKVIANAEATVHGTTPDKVHFHEVGAIDSIVDIVGVAVAFDLLKIDRVVSGPIPTGFGLIEIDHGVCSVPAPGTVELLKGIPLRDTPVEMELTTPTGAAIAKVLVDAFDRLPEMTIEAVGHGGGTKDVPGRANLLRVFIGEAAVRTDRDEVVMLETNLDDVSGEVIGHTKQQLLSAGALDVFTTAIQMKKDRPGTLLAAICRPADLETLERLIFSETGTLGIRRSRHERSVRSRKQGSVDTVYGSIDVKIAERPGYSPEMTPEFESCAAAASEHGVPLRDVYRAAESAGVPAVIKPVSTSHDHSHDHNHDHSHSHDHSHDHGSGHDHG